MKKFNEMEETHMTGIISIENLPKDRFKHGDLGLQIANDGRVWVCINGISFIRFKPMSTDTMKTLEKAQDGNVLMHYYGSEYKKGHLKKLKQLQVHCGELVDKEQITGDPKQVTCPECRKEILILKEALGVY